MAYLPGKYNIVANALSRWAYPASEACLSTNIHGTEQDRGLVIEWNLEYRQTKWSKAHPHTDITPVATVDMILNEIMQFVLQHSRKEAEIDPCEQALCSVVIANPRSPYALHDWATHMGDKEMRRTHKASRQFRRNADHRGNFFFQSVRM